MSIPFTVLFRTAARGDDKVEITRLSGDRFEVSYTNTYTKNKRPVTTTYVWTDREVMRWMRSILGLLELDADPYESVQLGVPGMPDILLPVLPASESREARDRMYHRVLDALEFFMDVAPEKGAQSVNTETGAVHTRWS